MNTIKTVYAPTPSMNAKIKKFSSKLPDAQFGLVFAYNYFNFRPFEMMKKYFAEIYQKLKPGGML
jgi:predicted methyltransferase